LNSVHARIVSSGRPLMSSRRLPEDMVDLAVRDAGSCCCGSQGLNRSIAFVSAGLGVSLTPARFIPLSPAPAPRSLRCCTSRERTMLIVSSMPACSRRASRSLGSTPAQFKRAPVPWVPVTSSVLCVTRSSPNVSWGD
jgi:hypothetical protein